MKWKVHRVRFVEYNPKAIHCLALEDVADGVPKLAVSRADSSIEIWSIDDDWYQSLIIPGSKCSSVESLVWCGSRLFTAGLHGEITEWDLNKLVPKLSVDSFGGAVWSLSINHSRTVLAAGCEDGCTRLFSISDDDLVFTKALDSQEGRILSLSWHVSDNFLVTGSSDSMVKVYDLSTGRCTLRLTMEEFTSRCTLIWGVYITSNFTIITGDSLGNTQFWDGNQGTLLQSYNTHKADVLSICVNEAQDTVFSSGVDSKVVQFKLTATKGENKEWTKASVSRPHSHDIRALVMLDSRDLLISGGVDTKLGVCSMSKFHEERPMLIASLPHAQIVKLASHANIIMCQEQSILKLWRLGESVEDITKLAKSPLQLVHIAAKSDTHILCSAISPCATWVAFSDVHHVSLFRLTFSEDNKAKVKRVLPLPGNLSPAHQLQFTRDSSRLVCANCESIQVLELGDEISTCDVFSSPLQGYYSVRLLAVSPDHQWAASVNSQNTINLFDLEEKKYVTTLPRYNSAVTAMAFQPKTNHLAMVCANRQIYVYDTENMRLSEWSKTAMREGLPTDWMYHHRKITSITFSPKNHELMCLGTHRDFTLVDLGKPCPAKNTVLFRKSSLSGVRKRAQDDPSDEHSDTFRICEKYGPLLLSGFNGDNSLVVVERPWMDTVQNLPPALYRKRYGR
ncbi:U3 small nucleolar RNA-associated protein 4 homolog isoform X2 [Nematostella vectensis]|uniref:U3 small nucleolar RNA-associated protein 4 homolog isoform X2 n=1 Tax=Nematostella vectensis TaxID=45351 RepID=UPI00207735A5|nr:U3 small nucleolar RNA-associated protein 4 homolog isoform X2 [Nematostella vectensis]